MTDAPTFPTLLADIVRDGAEHPALITADETLTYAELERRSAWRGRCSRAGPARARASPCWRPTAPFSSRRSTPPSASGRSSISTLATPPELAHIVRTSDAQILVGARRFRRRDFGQNLEAALPGLADARAAPSALERTAPAIRVARRCRGSAGTTGRRPAGARRVRRRSRRRLLAAVEREVSPADDAFVVYTSGSTATPKAVVHGQRRRRKPQALAPIFLMTSDDRTMPLLPAFWLGGIAAALQVLCTGSTLVYPPSPDIDDVLDMIERHDVTYVVVWHTLAKLRAAGIERGIDVDRIRGLGRPRGRGRRTDPRVAASEPPRHVRELLGAQRRASTTGCPTTSAERRAEP